MNNYRCVMRSSYAEVLDGSHNLEEGHFIEFSTDDFHLTHLEGETAGLLATSYFQVRHSILGWSATLEVEYSFNPSGTQFSCHAKRYRAGNNGRKKGNVILGFGSEGIWWDRELTNDNANQDGQWHNIGGGGTVAGNYRIAYIYFKFIYDLPSSDSWASILVEIPFSVAPPAITNPGVVRTPHPTISGTGIAGAEIKLYQHNVPAVVLATTTVQGNNSWSVPLERSLAMADPFYLTARQTWNALLSGYTPSISFAVLFKPVIFNVTVSADGKPTISGAGGLKDAELQIFFQGGAGGVQLASTVFPNGTWSVSATTAWQPGKHIITARQKANNTGEYSGWSETRLVEIKPPKPAISPPPTPAAAKQPLTITGVASGTVTLQMFNEAGVPVVGSFTGSGTTRTFTPTTNWAAGITRVKVVQAVNGMASDSSALVSIGVRPSKLVITPPPNPAATNQPLTITGVAAGAVTLQMFNEAGVPVVGSFTGSGTTRTFTPTTNWAAGITRVKVVQTVSGMASDSSALVSIAVKPSKLVITPPPNPAATNQPLTITGVAAGAVTLQMFNEAGAPAAGSFTGSGTTRTFTPTASWAAGMTRVKVVQIIGDVASDPSNLVSVVVKPSRLVIKSPPIPAAPKEQLTINNVVAGDVTLQVLTEDGEAVPGYFSGIDGLRTFTPAMDWTGTTKVKALQAVDDVFSDPSEPVTVSVTAKPPKPAITHPLPKTSHLANLRVEGNCVAGATVSVQDETGEPVQGTVTYDATTWFFEFPWQPGQQLIKAQQSLNGETSDVTDVLEFYIKPPKPAVVPPPVPVELKQPLNITGVASGAVTLKMLTDNDGPIAGDFTGSGAERTFTPAAEWLPGENTVKVVQAVNGVDSDPSDMCTFTVEVPDRPDPPRFQQPQRGAGTSRYPTIEVVGLPGALHTVRLVGGDTLCEDTADADGILEFTVVNPLEPGRIELQAKQASNGLDSAWSTPHAFTVHAPPATPVIRVPGANGNASRRPRIQGGGETGGQIVLRHVAEPELPFAFIDGSTNWRWSAEDEWDVDTYDIQAQQVADGDCSEWTQPHRFHVVESLYGIGDAIPVLGTPVVGTGQSVVLRVQVISADTGVAVEGVKVQWRLKGELEPVTETTTDFKGWTQYAYTPETVGKREILADITQANEGVVMTETYEVNAVQQDEWAKEAELYLDGQRVDLAVSDLLLLRKSFPYKLELKVNDGSVLIDSTITLQNFWGAEERGLTFIPDLGTPQVIKEGVSVHWSVFAGESTSGVFGLSLSSPVMSDWQLPAHVEAGDLAEAVKVDLDTFPQLFGGGPAFPCLGAKHTVTVRPQDHSFLLGHDVVLELSAQAAELGVTVSPTTPQTLGDDGVSWSLNCVDSAQAGNFAVWLKVPARDFNSLELPMSLGHNKVNISEKFGPQEMGGSASYWRYGIRATSTFTGQPAGRVPVTVAVTGKPTVESLTDSNGWRYINYYDGESASLTIRNRYDGSNG